MDDTLIKYSQIGEIFDCLSLGVIIMTRDRRIVSANRFAEQLTGVRASDVAGKYCYDVFKDYLCGGSCKYLDSTDSGKPVVTRLTITDQINDRFCITKIEAPLFNRENQKSGCIEVFQDNSVFKDLIKRIRHDDLRLKLILDNLDIGVMTLDRGSHVSFFNTMAETITGFSRFDVLGKPCDTLFGPDFSKDILPLRKSVLEGDTGSGMETRLATREGRDIPVMVNFMALKNDHGEIVGGLATLSDLSLKYHFNSAIRKRYTFYDMVGKDPAMRKIFEIIPVVAASDVTVLIEGPTGTGKDVIARIIHNISPRAKKPMVKVNCAALPDNLLESEMFGYVKGAFTGADRDKPGRFNEADGGTIFLDEIGDLPLSLQAKLLRVLEDREFYALGSRRTSRVDVRILSATNRNLEQLVREKQFREDLFYRLNVMRLDLPPLRERKSDIPLLIAHILKRLCATRDIREKQISENAMEVLLNYDYPGNIRELENILEHALIICQGSAIERNHFPVPLLKNVFKAGRERTVNPGNQNDNGERGKIIAALRRCNWNRGQTAGALGIDRSTLWRKMKKYGI